MWVGKELEQDYALRGYLAIKNFYLKLFLPDSNVNVKMVKKVANLGLLHCLTHLTSTFTTKKKNERLAFVY